MAREGKGGCVKQRDCTPREGEGDDKGGEGEKAGAREYGGAAALPSGAASCLPAWNFGKRTLVPLYYE